MKNYFRIILITSIIVLNFSNLALPDQEAGDISSQIEKLNDRITKLEARIFTLESQMYQNAQVQPNNTKNLSLEERVNKIEDQMKVRVYLLDHKYKE